MKTEIATKIAEVVEVTVSTKLRELHEKLTDIKQRHTLENVRPLFFHLILVGWKNNGVTFSNVFCNGEFEFAIIFFF